MMSLDGKQQVKPVGEVYIEEDIQVPCEKRKTTTIQQRDDDGNDCTDGKIAGGILGGAAGAALSQDEGRWWAIPLGVVTGSAIGCDIDGG